MVSVSLKRVKGKKVNKMDALEKVTKERRGTKRGKEKMDDKIKT